MCKKLCLICCISLLLVEYVSVADTWFTGDGGDEDWFNVSNWNPAPPAPGDTANLNANVTLTVGQAAVCGVAQTSTGGVPMQLDIHSGASLTTGGSFFGAYDTASTVTTNIAGTLTVGGEYRPAYRGTEVITISAGASVSTSDFLLGTFGTGTVNMNGGTLVSSGGLSRLLIGVVGPANAALNMTSGSMSGAFMTIGSVYATGVVGHVQLDGGLINIGDLFMNDAGPGGTMDITGGTMKILGWDATLKIDAFKTLGYITGYGLAANVQAVFDGTDTIVTAINPSGDLDGDRYVDLNDLKIIASNWLFDDCDNVANISGDCRINLSDFSTFAEGWLNGISLGNSGIEKIGLYTYFPSYPIYYDFWRNSGFTTIEILDNGWNMKPSLHANYYANSAASIDDAHNKSLDVSIIILACMNQWNGPEDWGYAGSFVPSDINKMNERLGYIQNAVSNLSNADRFIFFVGDPGVTSEPSTSIDDCIVMAQSVEAIVQQHAPNAEYLVNLWAVPEWDNYPAISPFTVDYWKEQVRLSQYMTYSTLFDSECGIMFTLDNYYRTLALHCYSTAGETPVLFPLETDVENLRQAGVTNIWGWPHFLINEFDDGYTGASMWQTQLEIRYIKKLTDNARSLGLYGLTSNCDPSPNEGLNTYAFARMCREPNLTVTEMFDEIASLLADSTTKGRLVNILKFVENNSTWHASMPVEYQEVDLDTGNITSATIALSELNNVNALSVNPLPLPDTPLGYLNRIRSRLEYIRDN